ncbi:MAG: hypothetical protein ABIY70_15775 [Capsulimonas sp.]|uniref:hypothetical protein n=1 Tax=Capsulimonas sp. TaxID=2494211 RepID=UPI00326542D1
MRSSFSPHVLSRRHYFSAGAVLFTVCLAITVRTAPVEAAGAPASLSTPLQVANALDKIVQPRFQVDAGQFGEDRIISELDGHPRIDEIDAETKSERRRFRSLRAAGRSYVIGMIHIAHKPGSHIHTHDHGPMDKDFVPSADSLVSVNSTEKRAEKSYDWATTHLTKVVTPYLAAVKRGRPANVEYGGWLVALRPVRAEHDTCITCHVGAHRGDTLGVMTYAINKTKSDRPITAVWAGGS